MAAVFTARANGLGLDPGSDDIYRQIIISDPLDMMWMRIKGKIGNYFHIFSDYNYNI